MGGQVAMPSIPSPTLTPFQAHAQKWRDCKHCCLCEGRDQVCLARGKIPADVVLVGEAPGVSEDAIGQPFVGPAGKLLDQLIDIAWRDFPALRWVFTNLVACFPREEKMSGVNEPPDEAIEACAPRLQEMVKLANPKLIVCVGTLARDWLDPKRRHHIATPKVSMIDITHPAAILRATTAQQGLMKQRVVVTLKVAVERMLGVST